MAAMNYLVTLDEDHGDTLVEVINAMSPKSAAESMAALFWSCAATVDPAPEPNTFHCTSPHQHLNVLITVEECLFAVVEGGNK